MQVITRYVLADFLWVLLLTLAVSVSLLLFVGAMLDLPKDVGAAEIVLMLPYFFPEALRNALEASSLFAACSVFGRLSNSNELLALSALGISPWRVIRPVLLMACLLSVICVWLYDVGEAWGKRGIERVVVESAEAIAYRYLRNTRNYSRGPLTLNVRSVEGRKLIRPTLIMETSQHPEPVTVAAEEGELRLLGADRGLSLVMRNGTAYIGDEVSMNFPDTMEQIIPLSDPARRTTWPPQNIGLADLHDGIELKRDQIERLEQLLVASRRRPPTAPGARATTAATARALTVERDRLHWFQSQVNRRWTNGFFCLAYVMIGIPVAMRMRSRDYLSSFFACFLPIVIANNPLHNLCIKLAESGRAPALLPCAGDLILMSIGGWLLYRTLRH